MRTPKLYIVMWRYRSCDETVVTIGYLPYDKMPQVLQEALFAGDICHAESGGVRGIYSTRKLADAHLRAERKWRQTTNRKNEDLWVVAIEGQRP